MQCPLCIETVLEPRFHGGVEIDVCPTCKGVWLDRGELDKLAAPPAAPAPARQDDRRSARDDDSWDDDNDDDDWDDDDRNERPKKKSKKKKKRKKSFGDRLSDVLEEVLDFD